MPVYVFVKIIIISLLQLPPSEDLYLTFTIAVIIIAGIFIYLARHIILRKKTSYDEAKLDSKKDRDYEKYHSEWSEEEIFGCCYGRICYYEEKLRRKLLMALDTLCRALREPILP